MEIIKSDMTREELQHYVELMLSLSHGSLKALTQPVLISMHNGLMENAMAFNNLEDKYRELLQKGNYVPLAKPYKRKGRSKNPTAMERAFNNGGRD